MTCSDTLKSSLNGKIKMSYTDFSTENADYRLILSMHLKKNKEPVKDLDAIILESGSIRGTIGALSQDLQYKGICKTAGQNKIPVYIVDVKPRGFLSCLETMLGIIIYSKLAHIFVGAVMIPALVTSFFKGKTLPGLTDYVGFPWWLIQGPIGELRSAVCARKTEEFIAPQLKEKLRRKPKIGIVYGAPHAGIKLDLKYKKMRDFTIWNHKKFNFKEYFGLTKEGRENLNKIKEGNYENGAWVVKKHNLGEMF